MNVTTVFAVERILCIKYIVKESGNEGEGEIDICL